jgi:hypothetical protein
MRLTRLSRARQRSLMATTGARARGAQKLLYGLRCRGSVSRTFDLSVRCGCRTDPGVTDGRGRHTRLHRAHADAREFCGHNDTVLFIVRPVCIGGLDVGLVVLRRSLYFSLRYRPGVLARKENSVGAPGRNTGETFDLDRWARDWTYNFDGFPSRIRGF